jgi:hypothetical protein
MPLSWGDGISEILRGDLVSMDFELTEEQKRFKQEVCDFLDREVTKEVVEESELGLGYGPHS